MVDNGKFLCQCKVMLSQDSSNDDLATNPSNGANVISAYRRGDMAPLSSVSTSFPNQHPPIFHNINVSNENKLFKKAPEVVTQFQKTLDGSLLKELKDMEALGLPTYFMKSNQECREVCKQLAMEK